MSSLHLFVALRGVSFLSAVVLPPRFTTLLREMFSPVSCPASVVTGPLYGRVNPDCPSEDGSPSSCSSTS